MKYSKQICLKNGKELTLRNGSAKDAEKFLPVFLQIHAETDDLLTYPDEISFTVEEEAYYLQKLMDSNNEIGIMAFVDGKIVGSAGIEAVDSPFKVRHRAEFGISILKDYWHLGIGRALTQACIECAKEAGYVQLELTAVAENTKAIALYKSVGFREYGRNPKGFFSRLSGYQEIVYMRLEL